MGLFSKSETVQFGEVTVEPFAQGIESFPIPADRQVDFIQVVKNPDGSEHVEVAVVPKPVVQAEVVASLLVTR